MFNLIFKWSIEDDMNERFRYNTHIFTTRYLTSGKETTYSKSEIIIRKLWFSEMITEVRYKVNYLYKQKK